VKTVDIMFAVDSALIPTQTDVFSTGTVIAHFLACLLMIIGG